MNIKKLAIAAAIVSTLGFSCHNEPDYAREGMSNPPSGSGNGTAPPTIAAPAAAPAAAKSAAPAARPDSTKAAKK